jgi:hypothetical protein
MPGRIAQFWVYGTGPAALLLLLLAPSLLPGQGWAVAVTYLALPAYMLHQVEEHDDDRFRRYVAALLGPGRAGLSPAQVAVINLGLVWLPLGLAVNGAALGAPAWAALAGWLLLVNAVVHVLPALALRRSNPGLVTAVVLFLPLGAACLAAAGPVGAGSLAALAFVLLVHAGIVLMARAPAQG